MWSLLPRILSQHVESHSVVSWLQHQSYDPNEPCKHVQSLPHPRCYFLENCLSFFLFAYSQLLEQTRSCQQSWWNWIYSKTVLRWSPSLHLRIQKKRNKEKNNNQIQESRMNLISKPAASWKRKTKTKKKKQEYDKWNIGKYK